MEDQSSREFIEFEEIDGELLSASVARKSFRIPLIDKPGFLLMTGQKFYSLANISVSGIGILVESESSFFLGQVLTDCELILFKNSIKGLQGKIVHCSADVSGKRLCGVKWLNPDPRSSKKIEAVILALKKKIFGDNQSENHIDPENHINRESME